MLQDFAARGIATQNRARQRRLDVVSMLQRSIAQNLPLGLPAVMAVPIAESRSVGTTPAITTGITYGFNSGTPASDFQSKFALYGGTIGYRNANTLKFQSHHLGNGSDPTANFSENNGAVVRFSTWADKFEVWAQNFHGFRVRVNGKYTKAGLYGVAAVNGDASDAQRYWLFDFAGTEFAGEGLKHVEIVGWDSFWFRGIRVPVGYTIEPWPAAIPLKCTVHGDSKVNTIVDSANYYDAQHGTIVEVMQALTGLPNLRATNMGGCGFTAAADNGGTRSDFLEQATVDFAGQDYDVVWELGGVNDSPADTNSYRDRVLTWIDTVLADNPDTIVILTGPIPKGTAELYSAGGAATYKQLGKKAAAALRPLNCCFIETIGNAVLTGDGWVFGTGKVGGTTSDGNADKLTGTDGVHLSIAGHLAIGHRTVSESGRVLAYLAARIRDGVISGVNDLDLV